MGMVAFAANSLLCRAALVETSIDAGSFTALRLLSGALVLWLLVLWQQGAWQKGMRQQDARSGHQADVSIKGDWLSALALFVYAAGFSFAYINLPAGSGALLLFGAVQVSMISVGLFSGERLNRWQVLGFGAAFSGLVGLLLPGAEAPPLMAALLMVVAGIAWGVYSLRGRAGGAPLQNTAGNFIRSVPMVLVLMLGVASMNGISLDASGILLAIASGGLASGVGYAIWYSVLPALKATMAAIVQLSVPIIATFGGLLWLDEPVSLRLILASVAVLGGIALFIVGRQRIS